MEGKVSRIVAVHFIALAKRARYNFFVEKNYLKYLVNLESFYELSLLVFDFRDKEIISQKDFLLIKGNLEIHLFPSILDLFPRPPKESRFTAGGSESEFLSSLGQEDRKILEGAYLHIQKIINLWAGTPVLVGTQVGV